MSNSNTLEIESAPAIFRFFASFMTAHVLNCLENWVHYKLSPVR